jgi:two-component system, cell cycle sensor histidine kinase and response regulator CckA
VTSMFATLERRVTLAVTALLILVIGGMFWLSHSRVVDAVSSSELARLQASADQLARTLTSQARGLIAEGSRVASLPELRDALQGGDRQKSAMIESVLAKERAANRPIRDLTLFNASGQVIASTRGGQLATPDKATRLETVAGPVVGPLAARADTVMYSVTAPVIGLGGARIGQVVITRQLGGGGNESGSLMSGLVGRGARVLLGNADGSLMTDLVAPVRLAGHPRGGTSARYADSAGRELLGASALVGETPWMVIVEAPRAGVLSAASDFTRDTAVVGLAFIVLGALLSWMLIRRTMRPLGEVTDVARDIAAGNLARRANVRGRSEIAVLGEAFNQMVERVGRSATDLAARATQLETSNKELNESETRYRTLFEHLPDGIIVHRNNRFLFANPAAIRLLGVGSEAELADRNVLDFIESTDRETARARIGRVERHGETTRPAEMRLQRADRKVATVEVTSMPLRVDDAPAVQTILHDVSERRLLEEQFRQSQKMDAVGRLAGGVAHDFNNLLTVIQAHAEFAMTSTDADERQRDIAEIRKTADNAARLTRQLLTFSRKQAVTPTHIDLNEAIAGMLGMVGRIIGDNIEVVTVAGRDLAGVYADAGQVQQVLLNLAVNARDAMPDGGVLRFETANVHIGEGYLGASSAAIPPGDYVMLAVQDTGVGMSEDIRSRVFEPFFTTKQPGRGTGLGLSTVYGIVKQAGGHIWVYSEPGMGTAFKVFLPPHHLDDYPVRSLTITGSHSLHGQGHLLVVEDDASVRSAVVRALRAAGYSVTEARDGEQALEIMERQPDIDLVITDMVMPGMPGLALLAEIRKRRPDLPAIVLSGYSEHPANTEWRVADQAVFVEKPVSPSDLIRRIGQMLTSRDEANA